MSQKTYWRDVNIPVLIKDARNKIERKKERYPEEQAHLWQLKGALFRTDNSLRENFVSLAFASNRAAIVVSPRLDVG